VVPPKTLRRKLQKKAKRKGWTNCPQCGRHGRFHVTMGGCIVRMCPVGRYNEICCGWGKYLYWPGRVAER
jgi:RNase P subunit RPR2